MKQTISVNLNRQVFYLDTDAYEKLNKYLEEIKKYFAKNGSSTEVVDDIEARIAEKFGDIIGKSKKAIQISDVEKIIEEMGSVDDITGEETTETTEEPKNVKRKLFRDPDNKIIAGIAAGLSWYSDIKPIWIRLIFLILLLNHATFWLAIAAYIAAWLVISEAKTSWEKLEMRGKPTTVNELQTAIEQKASAAAATVETKTRNVFQKIVSAFLKLIKFGVVLACRLTGFFTLLSLICTVVALVVGLVFVYFEPVLPYFDFSFLREIGTPLVEIIFVAMGVIMITPLVFFMDLADSLMRWKWSVSMKKIVVMMTVWIAAVMLFSGIAKLNYPKYGPKMLNSINRVKYLTWIDETNSKNLEVKTVSNIDISAVREVVVTEGQKDEVKIVGSQFAIDELKSDYTNNKLTIKGESEKWFGCKNCGGYVSPVRVEITTKKIDTIKLNDNIEAKYYPRGGSINADLGTMVGLKVIGKLDGAKISAGDGSVVNLIETEINQVSLELKEATAKVWAKKININGDSQSTLIYKGTPEIVGSLQDKSRHEKYNLSEDGYEKLSTTVGESVVTIGGVKKKIKDFVWSKEIVKQKDETFYNLFTSLKLKSEDTDSYVVWLVEKDGKVSLRNSLKMTNWEKINNIYESNNKTLEVEGEIYGPEVKTENVSVFVDKAKGVLEIKPTTTEQ